MNNEKCIRNGIQKECKTVLILILWRYSSNSSIWVYIDVYECIWMYIKWLITLIYKLYKNTVGIHLQTTYVNLYTLNKHVYACPIDL